MAYVAHYNISHLTVQSTRNPYHCRWVLNSTLNSFSYTTDAIWSFQISQNVWPINAVLCNEYYVVELAWGVPLDFGVSILITKFAEESASSAKGRVTALPWIGFSIWYLLEKKGTRLLPVRVLLDLKCCQETRSHERRVLVPALYISTFLRDNRCDSMLQSVLACICLSVFSSRMCL